MVGVDLVLAAAGAVFFTVTGIVLRRVPSHSTGHPGFLVASSGVVFLMWPFTVLSVSDAGLELRHRLSRLLPWLLERETWRAGWCDVAVVEVTRRTFLVKLKAGRGCRYAGYSVAQTNAAIASAAANGVPVHRVSSTLFARRRSPDSPPS